MFVDNLGTSPFVTFCHADGELRESSTIREFRIVQNEGEREVARNTKFYNLDMILAIGYRVRSNVGMQFRNLTSKVLKEYMQICKLVKSSLIILSG